MPDPRYGERVAAFVLLQRGASLSLDDVRASPRLARRARRHRSTSSWSTSSRAA
jgi:hypothetical protein